jgi:uncharacterized protein (DUF433 family)
MSTEFKRLMERIVVNPEILSGKPIVKGTRVSVELVLDRLAAEPNLDIFFEDYPHLTVDDVRACLAYGSAVVGGEEIHFFHQRDDVLSAS